MKVCLLTRSFSLEGGGIGRVSLEIKNELKKRGHTVHAIAAKGSSLYSYFFYTLLDIPLRLPGGMDVYHALTPMESIWIPKGKSISVVHDIVALTHPERYGGRLGYGRGIVTFHDIFTITNPKELGAGIDSCVKRFISKNYFKFACIQALKCRFVVAVSEHVKGELQRYFGVKGDKIKVIKSGIRSDLEPRVKRDGVFRIGYLGQLDKRKRVDLLIEAFKRSRLDAELVIGGSGLVENELRKKAEGDNRIRFLGLIPDDKLVDFYNSLDVFVFPTAIEGYGLPPIEAMACEKPTIVLNDSIIPYEVKKRCIIAKSLDLVFGNINYLKNLIAHVDYKDNYRFAKEHSWSKCVDEYVKLYERIVDEQT